MSRVQLRVSDFVGRITRVLIQHASSVMSVCAAWILVRLSPVVSPAATDAFGSEAELEQRCPTARIVAAYQMRSICSARPHCLEIAKRDHEPGIVGTLECLKHSTWLWHARQSNRPSSGVIKKIEHTSMLSFENE